MELVKRFSRQDVEDILSLSSLQEGILFHYLYEPESENYCEQLNLTLQGNVEALAVKKAWNCVAQTNEMLRTVFSWEKMDMPLQIVLRKVDIPLQEYDLTSCESDKSKLIRLQEIKRLDRRTGFDLQTGPLLRILLCRVAEDRYEMIISNHHIIFDGWSTGIILQEFFNYYHYITQGVTPSKVKKKGFKEYLNWVKKLDKREQEQYWRMYLNDFNTRTALPTDQINSSQMDGYTYCSQQVCLSNDLTLGIKELAMNEKTTLGVIFYTLWGIILHKYNNLEDIIFGTTVSGRPAEIIGVEQMVGLFINTVPLRIIGQGTDSISQLFARVQEMIQARRLYEYTPLQEIKTYSELNSKEDIFDSIVVIENYPLDDRIKNSTPELTICSYSITEQTNYPLTLEISIFEELKLNFIYNRRFFEQSTIKRLLNNLVHLSTIVSADPEISLSQISLLTEAEKRQIMEVFNNTRVQYPREKTIGQLFAEQVERTPENLAVVYHDRRLTYRELNQRTSELAEILREQGTGPDRVVGLMLDRSIEMIVGVLAIIQAGGAYLPIDIDYPEERVQFMLEDSQAGLLLGQIEFFAKPNFPDEMFTFECLELFNLKFCLGTRESEARPNIDSHIEFINKPNDLAYIMYTSGSTGKPKGVMIEHLNINRLISNSNMLRVTEEDRILQTGSLAFDASTFEIWGALLNGAALYLVDKEEILSADCFAQLVNEYQITMIWLTAPLFNQLLEENPLIFKNLNTLLVGGDALSPRHINLVKARYPNLRIINGYGPTESTTFATYLPIEERYTLNIPIGYPVSNTQVYILDKYHNLQPIGAPGELCIAGDGLARGYLNGPELTAEKFIPNPFGEGRLYKTGDLARWLSDGKIEFLGRIDHQVKIRGFRIEPGEIESQLLSHPLVKEVVVVDKIDVRSTKYLAAYVVSEEEISGSDLRKYLSERMPDYMIPAYFVTLDKLPLTSNGKVNRKALPDVEPNLDSGPEYIAPATEIEKRLAVIWSEILGVNSIGINDDFFTLGGHSLKATQLVSKIKKEFNVNLPVKVIFQSSTIQELAEYIQQAGREAYFIIPQVPISEYYPVSSAQKRMYILNQLEPASTNYNITGTLKIEGQLNLLQLQYAICKLIQRHESLRTSFVVKGGKPVQIVHEDIDFTIKYISLSQSIQPLELPKPKSEKEESLSITVAFNFEQNSFATTAADREWDTDCCDQDCKKEYGDEVFMEVIQHLIQPFDLQNAPLLRVGIIELAAEQYYLFFDMHHIISDGVSMGILTNEFVELYQGKELPELRVHYKDFTYWQQKFFQTDLLQKEEEYWLNLLSDDLPILDLQTDYPRPSIFNYAGARLEFQLEEELVSKLRELVRIQGVTVYMLLLAAYNILLARYADQNEVLIGSPIAGRAHNDLEQIIGMFVNTLVMRNNPVSSKTFSQFLAEIKINTLTAFENQNYQFEMLVEKLALNRDLSRNPIFDTLFTVQNAHSLELSIPGLRVSAQEYFHNVTKFDLALIAFESSDKLRFNLDYRTDLFKRTTIRRMADHYINILGEIVDNREILLGQIQMISAVERAQILFNFNDTRVEYPYEKTVSQLFAEVVGANPDKIALVYEDQNLTYAELYKRANQLAQILRNKGVRREKVVGILAERSLEMIIGVLAIVQAGGAYLPLDPDYPPERMEYMLIDSQVDVLLTQTGLTERVNYSGELIDLTDEELYAGEIEQLEFVTQPGDLIYIIYTSGSTGQPKGVMIEHRNVNRLISNSNMLQIAEDERILQTGSLAFDASTFEIWGSFLNGATLYLVSKEKILSAHLLVERMQSYQITMIWLTAPLFNQLLEEDRTIFAELKTLIVGGDALSPGHINRVRYYYPNLQVINGYGPTESTTFTTFYPIEEEYDSNVPIGYPVSNTQVYIFSKGGQLQPVGVPGELCISGDGLARGYLNSPELTGKKFVSNPVTHERMYHTGDLARWLEDGTLEFLGRIDNQVKIRGFRIEIGEVENKLSQHENVSDVVVIANTDNQGNKYLCAYFTADQHLQIVDLRKFLAEKLPEYMIPAFFIQLERFPLNRNGKVDRKVLPEPEGKLVRWTEYAAPLGETEERLARIWIDILGIEQIGRNDNFFELGGHSLKATTLTSRIFKEFNVELPLRKIFQHPTVKGIGEYIRDSAKSKYLKIEKVANRAYYPLSSAQRRLFVLNQLDNTNITYNVFVIIEVTGELEYTKVQRAFMQLIERHEVFRTSFELVDGEAVQRVHPKVEFTVDLLAEQGRDKQQIFADYIKPFDLQTVPLLRVGLLNTVEQQYMIVDSHHIISDGVSMDILFREFVQLYQGQNLSSSTIQYRDFAVWQNQLFNSDSEIIQTQEKYWLNSFKDELPVLELPLDFPRPAARTYTGDTVRFILDKELKDKLNELTLQKNVTLYMLILAIYSTLLARYTGQEDLVVGSPIAGRHNPDIEQTVGMFVNTLAIRVYPENRLTFAAFLQRVKDRVLEVFENQDYQFEMLVDKLNLDQDLSRNPIFETMFVLQNANTTELEVSGMKLHIYPWTGKTAKFDLTLGAIETEAGLQMTLEYNTNLFKRATITRMANHFQNLVKDVVTNPQVGLEQARLLNVRELEELLVVFNATQADYPVEKTIIQLFTEVVDKNFDRQALVFQDQKLTYGELSRRARQLARALREKGAGPDKVIGIVGERSLEMIIGVLAIVYAGGAYLPIDPDYPVSRMEYMLTDSKAEILLIQRNLAEDLNYSGEIIDLIDETLYSGESELELINCPEDLIYIIYTSGSTGQPKGVMIEHRNVNRLLSNSNMLQISEGERILQTTSLAFDVSTFEIWGAFLNAATLYLVSKDKLISGQLLVEVIQKYRITLMWLTTPLFNQLLEEEPEIFAELQTLIVGGDALSPKHINQVRHLYPELRVINGYGPTESTTFATYYPIEEDYYHNVPIGYPLSNTQIYILSKAGELQPIGVPGELCIAGDGLARGYLNRPELTEEKFNFHRLIAKRIYWTGDLARWLADGRVEFLGRIDNQVKIRGFRIELDEITNRLLEHGQVKEAVVVDRTDPNNDKYLCAYLITIADLSISDLRDFLSARLPDYMIPSYFIQLDSLPLNTSGKINRKALPEPEITLDTGVEYLAPHNELEEKLVQIWSQVLAVERISVKDNFFVLGGHSLKGTQVVSMIHKLCNVEIRLADLFKHPTVVELAELIQNRQKLAYSDIKRLPEQESYDLSYAQKRLWIIHQLDPDSTAYNMPGQSKIDLPLDEAVLRKVLWQLIERHESLRTCFVEDNGVPVQIVLPVSVTREEGFEQNSEHRRDEIRLDLTIQDLTALTDCEQILCCQEVLKAEMTKSFDLEKLPLFRVRVLKYGDSSFELIYVMHHIITDGSSAEILQKEFAQLYQAYCLGEQLELTPLKIQYRDFAYWHNQLLADEEQIQEYLDFWQREMDGEIPVLNLPTDYSYKGLQDQQSAAYRFVIEEQILRQINRLAQTQNTSLFMVLLAGFNLFLADITDQDDLILGIPAAGREHENLRNVMGFFVNTLILRNQVDKTKNFGHLLKNIQDKTLQILQYQSYPLEKIFEKLKMPYPKLTVFFNLLNMGESNLSELNDLQSRQLKDVSDAKFDLVMYLTEYKNGIEINCYYYTGLFKPETIEHFMKRYTTILDKVSQYPDKILENYNINEDRRKLTAVESRPDLNEKVNPDRVGIITQIFEQQADKYPDKIVIQSGDRMLTYQDLNHQANRLANELLTHCKVKETTIGLLFEQGADMIIGVLGAIKAGMTYVPLEPTYPRDRLHHILVDAEIGIIVSNNFNQKLITRIMEELSLSLMFINLDTIALEVSQQNPQRLICEDKPAYILYTSGSTGRPKGVVQTQRNILHFVRNYEKYLQIGLDDRLTLFSTFTHDAAVMDIYTGFVTGATLYPVNVRDQIDIADLAQWMIDEKITVWHSVPTVFRFFVRTLKEVKYFPDLRWIVLGGEQVIEHDIQDFRRSFPNAVLVNLYGQSETSFNSAQYFHSDDSFEKITLGQPVDDTELLVIDQSGVEVPMFGIGEIVVASDYVAPGYWKNPEKTKQVFMEDRSLGRVYLTGDLGRRLLDGTVEFMGRKDFQVKIRGFRVELGEIESKILTYPGIREVVVTARDYGDNTRYLCAYLVTDTEVIINELRSALQQVLPDYMIPVHFITLEKMPLTSTNKIDRKALPVPTATIKTGVEYQAPERDIEKRLAELWARILKLDAAGIGTRDSFFDLGGNSLSIMELTRLVNEEFATNFKILDLFNYNTIELMASLIDRPEEDDLIIEDTDIQIFEI